MLLDRPNLRHLKAQAKDLLVAGVATSIADAQFQVARRYGFASWPKLKAYADANLIEILLRRAGGEAMADRLSVIAGPKVYSSRKRRFSSRCFGTIRTPQSSVLATHEAAISRREVARAARLPFVYVGRWRRPRIDSTSDIPVSNAPLLRHACFGR